MPCGAAHLTMEMVSGIMATILLNSFMRLWKVWPTDTSISQWLLPMILEMRSEMIMSTISIQHGVMATSRQTGKWLPLLQETRFSRSTLIFWSLLKVLTMLSTSMQSVHSLLNWAFLTGWCIVLTGTTWTLTSTNPMRSSKNTMIPQ